MQKKITVIAISTSDTIALGEDNILTFAAVGDAADYVLNAEVQLTDGGNWFAAQSAMVDSTIYSTTSGLRSLRFDVTGLGTATTIDIEVTGASM